MPTSEEIDFICLLSIKGVEFLIASSEKKPIDKSFNGEIKIY